MNQFIQLVKKYGVTFILISALWAAFSSCNGAATDDINNLNPGTGGGGGGGGGDTIPGTDDGIATTNDFYVGVDSSINTIAHVRTFGDFNQKCGVSSTAVASNDLQCYIDIPEGDLVYKKLAVKFNVPKDMCKYLVVSPYWFHNEQIGKGPGYLSTTVFKVTTVSATETKQVEYSSTASCTFGESPTSSLTTVSGCTSVSQETTITYNSTNGSVSHKCIYDQSGEDNRHNCCYGDVESHLFVSETEIDIQNGGSVSTLKPLAEIINVNTSWGRDLSPCLGGPGRTDWESRDNNGLPTGVVIETIDGKTQNVNFRSQSEAIDPTTFNNIHFASAYTPASHSHTGFTTSVSSTLPFYVEPIDDLSGTDLTLVQGNNSFTFECRDAAWEVKHRLKLYVRDWDTYTDYLAYIVSKGVSSTPDRPTQTAPDTNCEGLAGPCDDFMDTDDFVNTLFANTYYTSVHGSFGPYVTTPRTVVQRDKYYPYIIYK